MDGVTRLQESSSAARPPTIAGRESLVVGARDNSKQGGAGVPEMVMIKRYRAERMR
jgi:hypothetical protein